MPITSIIQQPAPASISAAYRPVVYRVVAVATNGTDQAPIVWCDIYFGGVYYKSLSATVCAAPGEWQFDIQDAAQEYLRTALAINGGSEIYQATRSMTRVFCRFRASGYTAAGFLLPEGTVPVQATGMNPAQPGTGLQSATAFIINSVLQHEDNQNLADHLNTYKTGTWSEQAFPLSHRPVRQRLTINDSDYFPLVYTGNEPLKCLKVNYRFFGQTAYQSKTKCWPIPCPEITPVLIGIVLNADTTQTITIGWQPLPAYVTGIKFTYRKTGTGNTWQEVMFPSVSVFSTTLPLGKYDFNVSANGDCLNVDPGQLLNVGEDRNPCAKVTGLVVIRLTASTWKLSWNAVTGSAGYTVYYQKQGDSENTADVMANGFIFDNLVAGGTYNAYVRNKCSPGTSDPSDVVTIVVPNTYRLKLNFLNGAISTYIKQYHIDPDLFIIDNSGGSISGAGGNAGIPQDHWLFERDHTNRAPTFIALQLYSSNGRQIVGNYQVWIDGVFSTSANVNQPNNSWLNVPVSLLDLDNLELKLNF